MAYHPECERDGWTGVYYRDSWRKIKLNEFEPLTTALRNGAEWYEGETILGEVIIIRLSDVVDVTQVTPAIVGVIHDDDDEREAYERTHGKD